MDHLQPPVATSSTTNLRAPSHFLYCIGELFLKWTHCTILPPTHSRNQRREGTHMPETMRKGKEASIGLVFLQSIHASTCLPYLSSCNAKGSHSKFLGHWQLEPFAQQLCKRKLDQSTAEPNNTHMFLCNHKKRVNGSFPLAHLKMNTWAGLPLHLHLCTCMLVIAWMEKHGWSSSALLTHAMHAKGCQPLVVQ